MFTLKVKILRIWPMLMTNFSLPGKSEAVPTADRPRVPELPCSGGQDHGCILLDSRV